MIKPYGITYKGDDATNKWYFKDGFVWLDKPLSHNRQITIIVEKRKKSKYKEDDWNGWTGNP